MDRNCTYHYEVDRGAYSKYHEQKHLKVMDSEELMDRENTYLQKFKEPVKEFKVMWRCSSSGASQAGEGIAQGMHARQDLKGEPPDRHVEVLIQLGILYKDNVEGRAPERWEQWECVPSQFEIWAATFGKPVEIASEISVNQPK